MSNTSFLKYCRLAYLSGPSSERQLYRQMVKRKPTRILEIGLGMGVRTLRMFEVAKRYCASESISYTGIDPFESRIGNQPALPLKDAYTLLRRQGVKVRLVPGDALGAMTLTANTLTGTDLIVIDSDIRDQDLANAWKYFPRMMNEGTLVLRQTLVAGGKSFERMTHQDIEKLTKDVSVTKTKIAA